MYITLIVLSCAIAVYFIGWSNRITKTWIRHTFILYGSVFLITAITISGIFILNHTTIKTATATNALRSASAAEAKTILEEKPAKIRNSVQLKAPEIGQLPELPRGCEVTSLAMLLEYHDITADKMKLANEIKMDSTPFDRTKNGVEFGNPNNGFVGDMYSLVTPGVGVYHKPITELASDYADERVLDFTGRDFDDIIHQLNQKRPVWVIINATYKKLSKQHFETWQTPDGPIEITMLEHSVLITGYDEDNIYFNDPLKRDEKAPIKDFKAAWEQMGKQAITIL